MTNGVGYTFRIPFSLAWTHWDYSNKLLSDLSVPQLKMQFYVAATQATNSTPFNYALDNIAVKYDEPKFLNPSGTPVKTTLTQAPTVTGTVIDGLNEVTTMMLYLDEDMVASNSTYAGGSNTNTISFTAAGLTAEGTLHSAQVVAMDATGTNSVSYSWSFRVYDGGAAAPETDPVALYNINIAGSTDGNVAYYSPVTNGLVAVAPSMGSNNWSNVEYRNPWWYGGFVFGDTISESSGMSAYTNTVAYQMVSGTAQGLYCAFGWDPPTKIDDYSRLAGTLFGAAMGRASADMNFELRNLDDNARYDLYLYFTCPDSTVPATTTQYSLMSGVAASTQASLVSSLDLLFDSLSAYTNNFVQGTNYVIITDISPEGGKIGFNATGDSNGGGVSAMQLVRRQPLAVFVPEILSFSATTGTATLQWNSKAGINYHVMHKSSLADPTWTSMTNVIGTAGTTSVSVPAASSQEFFQIKSN
jgi:hypothetical protein